MEFLGCKDEEQDSCGLNFKTTVPDRKFGLKFASVNPPPPPSQNIYTGSHKALHIHLVLIPEGYWRLTSLYI